MNERESGPQTPCRRRKLGQDADNRRRAAAAWKAVVCSVVTLAVMGCNAAQAEIWPVDQARAHMLTAINTARQSHGVHELRMGDSPAAQKHADYLMQHCVTSHWDMNNRPPHARYSYHGGIQPNAENIFSDNECGYPDTGSQEPISTELATIMAVNGLMNSEGHRETMLNPSYSKVSIGIAHNALAYKTVHVFEAERTLELRDATIKNGVLSVDATVAEGRWSDQEIQAALAYTDGPQRVTEGQLSRTGCYEAGQMVAVILNPSVNIFEQEPVELRRQATECRPPNLIGRTERAESLGDLLSERTQTQPAAGESTAKTETVWAIPTKKWARTGNRIQLEADIEPITLEHGEGYYTVLLLAETESVEDDPRILEHTILLD